MSEAPNPHLEVLLATFAALREEIQRRFDRQHGLTTLCTGSVGAIFSLALQQQRVEIVLAIPPVCALVLAFWLEHALQIRLLGTCLGQPLHAELRRTLGAEVLSWETWWREMRGRVPSRPARDPATPLYNCARRAGLWGLYVAAPALVTLGVIAGGVGGAHFPGWVWGASAVDLVLVALAAWGLREYWRVALLTWAAAQPETQARE